jgi:hypothetical protein
MSAMIENGVEKLAKKQKLILNLNHYHIIGIFVLSLLVQIGHF